MLARLESEADAREKAITLINAGYRFVTIYRPGVRSLSNLDTRREAAIRRARRSQKRWRRFEGFQEWARPLQPRAISCGKWRLADQAAGTST
jgi:hypothetical protein